jgi:non-heme chloroperoxidase
MNRRQIFATGALGAALAATQAGAQPRRRRVTIETRDGVRLFYRETGEGRPLVFMAGWALPSDIWNYQTVALAAQGFRCIAYDRRGHGRSDDPGRSYDFDTLSDDLSAVLEQLDLRDATLVGHSLASGEMVRYMTRHRGARVSKLIFIAPAATPYPAQYIPPNIAEQLRSQRLMHDFPRALREGLPPFLTPTSSQGMLDWVFNMMVGASHSAVVGCNIALTTADFRDELPHIDVPSLVIHGTRDVSAPIDLTGRPTAAAIPGAQLEVYQDAPHGVFLTEIGRVNAHIASFAG